MLCPVALQYKRDIGTPDTQDAIQRNMDKWVHGNLMSCKKTQCKVLRLGQDNLQYQHSLGMDRLRAALLLGGAGR